MDYYMNSQGNSSPCIKEYEIETTENLKKGTLLTLVGGKAEKLSSSSDNVLGLLAEDYDTNEDKLNPRSGSGKVKVIVSPGMIIRQKDFETAVTSAGSKTSIKVTDITLPSTANALAGGFVKLIKKAQDSDNTDHVGSVRRITASTSDTLTIENGGAACVGDIYAILPPAGFEHVAVGDDGQTLVIATSSSGLFKVAACYCDTDFCEFCVTKAFFA